MKNRILSIAGFAALTSISQAEVFNSPELNKRVWALQDVSYAVDVDMDGTDDIFFYGDLDALVRNAGQAYAYHLRLSTAQNTYVSTIGVPSGPEELTYMFTTFQEGVSIDEDLTSPFYEWSSGDIPFLGFQIAGGIPSRDSFLAVKIIKESSVHYGWIRLIFPITYDYFDETGYVKIKESGYQTAPSSAIVAGLGKTEKTSSYSNNIEISGAGTFDIEVNSVSNMQCMLQESIDLLDWNTISVEYSTQPNLTKSISTTGTSKYYRWQVTENLEEID